MPRGPGGRRYSFRLLVNDRRLENELDGRFASDADAVQEAQSIAFELVRADAWWLTVKATIIVSDDADNELAVPVREGAEHHRLSVSTRSDGPLRLS
ncbi:hypothetical protein PQJ75_27485 [Rhodoplanes sp. TEM]|uniref:Uncharacterized protein n=1 Tax=Rhodoplanes tepidamans TaxID=200616 RepID=A0ABT5J6C3_RHOTP|nr:MULTISPECIES: hypothetical protein [Rhodoplanes]MDC7785191.1 hypothetical protein [Rhodoplanes tepidamans]MDC7987493.1 hypothetical protein [Rhodoplanes sp. TEM]MDQ0353449.1 hypothetical protein [Rhodoplanes tepidamans]